MKVGHEIFRRFGSFSQSLKPTKYHRVLETFKDISIIVEETFEQAVNASQSYSRSLTVDGIKSSGGDILVS